MDPTNGAPTPPDPEAVTPDIPDAAFGFVDDTPRTPTQRAAPASLPPVTIPPRPQQPEPITPAPQPEPMPVPVPPPVPRPAVVIPAPAPEMPTPPVVLAAPMPADVLPPKQVPALPTLAAGPETTAPIAPAPPPTYNPAEAQPIPLAPRPFTAQPVRAAPAETTSVSFSPTPVTHLPDEIAARITETPMQNSTDVAKEIEHGSSGNRLKSLLSIVVFVAAIFVAAFLINQFIFQSYYVEGTSMTPTLQNNDRLIISKVERSIAAITGHPYIPERGQIVVLDSSIVGLNGQKEQLIKRVIGLPGDRIHIDNGIVTITNSQHPNGYDVTQALGLTNLQPTYTDTPIDLTVPTGQVYVMGDNREQGGSYDSRVFGPIDGDKSKAVCGRGYCRLIKRNYFKLTFTEVATG